ncbi:MAG: putative phosphoglycerate mutase [Phormidesmis priestleyi Ana]|uniref:phosphoglycerate mutase (2,3-diphosphoglycerate-dependent) n=1 Tax=Phormidesmis priestleyi Ana TaxID=1666911 RepID=A0A0N8KN70_9CYAN|nr:MAG: putative phosphoglycerate mutase [Phormidesmis priestleyi Ana]
MSLKLYLLRHGETEFSINRGYCGALDADLTDSGRAMAQAFADEYKSLDWAAIYCSPMKRAIATATPLADAIGQPLIVRDGIKECNYGEWEGKTKEEVDSEFHDDYVHWMTEPAWNAPKGGESAVQVRNRAMTVIAEIEEQYTEGNVLMVAHRTTLRIVLCSLLGIDLGRYRDRLEYPAASLSVVSFKKYGPLLERMGDRSFMPKELQAREG